MDPSSLNLFGLADGDGLAELKRRYYELALLCHPDRGGCAEDMVVVQAQYTHAKRELEAKEESMERVQKAKKLKEEKQTSRHLKKKLQSVEAENAKLKSRLAKFIVGEITSAT